MIKLIKNLTRGLKNLNRVTKLVKVFLSTVEHFSSELEKEFPEAQNVE